MHNFTYFSPTVCRETKILLKLLILLNANTISLRTRYTSSVLYKFFLK